ncbi:MAG: replication protein [Candidatus Omnitrophica bacterium]|nr:replication protein [Candidatus Omnitrophota bacterium]
MANPQKENGHTDIANEIVEILARINFRPYESRTLWALWRKTWGWHKKEDKISLTQFQALTGLERRHQHKALKTLIEKNIITRNTDSYVVSYSFQKDYTRWKVVLKQAPVSDVLSSAYLSTTPVLKQAPKVVPKSAPTKENKETIQKKGNFSNHLLIFKTQIIQLAEQYSGNIDLIKQHLFKDGYTEKQIEEALNKYITTISK